MPKQAEPHEHVSAEEVIQPHEDMLADTPRQAIGEAFDASKDVAIAALREMALRCCRCDLCGTGHGVDFGEGSPAARLMIIGEAPVEEEDKRGKPFQGRAGQMLNTLLEEAGITREDVWVT